MAQIKTFARLKPTKKAYKGYEISKNVLTMHIPDNKDFVILGPQSNYRSNFSYDILFTNIFGCEATQEEVFDGVAKDIIQNFLNGYNGTIFAYGQTGTGKTYTVEGNTNRYNARGLATRALSMIYQELEKRSDQHISVYLSYLEIYQEVAYDLLNPAARSSILRGLSLHLAANEEIAQMLLLQGQANRKVAETPVNQRSSRSHAVFTVYLQVRNHDSDVLVNSKLHLVDLAGSERVSKTGVDGQQLTEAKSINLSLHHLETVIIALQLDKPPSASGKGENPPQQSRSNTSLMSSGPSSDNGGSRQLRFVPYRNSLLTMVLKDSLGGNCLTAMIATISLEPENLGESISTCRFAQRVARIANNAKRNEEIDDKALIKRLKNKVAYLENQVALLRSKGCSDPVTDEEIMNVLTDEDQRICEKIMEGFLQGIIADPIEAGISDHCRFRACLHLLKRQFLTSNLVTSGGRQASNSLMPLSGSSPSTPMLGPRHASPQSDQPGRGVQLPGGGANNPQQDSGDYAAVPMEAKDRFDLRDSKAHHSHNVRNSQPLYNNFVDPNGTNGSRGENLHGDQQQSVPLAQDDGVAGSSSSKQGKLKPSSRKPGTSGGGGVSGIEQLLEACPSEQKYKSPYERRREKEIRRLSRKLTEMEEDKAGRETYLQQMKEQAIVEELLVAETGLRLKLQVAEEQVADQHAYLLQLKHLQADPDLIAKEQLVEKQLRKRQAKFHEKLTKVLASKEKLEKDFSAGHSTPTPLADGQQQQQPQGGAGESSSKASLEERFGQYKQGKGSLNTRQVFDMLKNQEKKQQKESAKVERETTMVKTKQLAIKEAATLEKLRELKQMLKLSLLKEEQQQQQQQQLKGPSEHDFSASCSRGGEVSPDKVMSNSHIESAASVGRRGASQAGPYPSSAGLWAGKGGGSGHQAWSADGHRDQNQSQRTMTAAQSQSVHQFMTEVLGEATARTNGSVSGPSTSAFQSGPYNLPPSSHGSNANTFRHGNVNSSRSQSLVDNHNFSNGGPISSESKGNELSAPVNNLHNSFKLCNETETLESDTRFMLSDKPERFPSTRASLGHQNHNMNNANTVMDKELLLSDLEPEPVGDSKHVNSGLKTLDAKKSHTGSSDVSSSKTYSNGHVGRIHDNVQESGASPLPTLLALQQQMQQQQQQHSKPVVPPSEYINSMSEQDKFDARRMGLSSRTFESALTHMLDGGGESSGGKHSNAPDLPYNLDPYESFSRSPRQQQAKGPALNGLGVSESPYQHRHQRRSSPKRKTASTGLGARSSASDSWKVISAEPGSAWGPESKNASVADRLANLLDGSLPYSSGKNQKVERRKKNISSPDAFQIKLNEFKSQSHHKVDTDKEDDDDDDDDDDDSDTAPERRNRPPKCGEDEEDRSFFGLHPAPSKITAITAEEGEKTFLSAVAAEKARVEKIRRARNAAELIQRQWRKCRSHE